ncbi:hypothetical protein HYR54_12585 [Candidatus Acetothermia bacterium]|nr:hypothetical protein [Candidatus Acetothermia bacterium]
MSIQKMIVWEHHPLAQQPTLFQQLPAVGGFDLGRWRHPSHCAILLPENERPRCQRFIQIASIWLDQEPYLKQIQTLDDLNLPFRDGVIFLDNTRDELTALREIGQLPSDFRLIQITAENKFRMAHRLLLALEEGRLVLLPDERQKKSLLQVNMLLRSDENAEVGHGEALTSLMLALEAAAHSGWSSLDLLRQLRHRQRFAYHNDRGSME